MLIGPAAVADLKQSILQFDALIAAEEAGDRTSTPRLIAEAPTSAFHC